MTYQKYLPTYSTTPTQAFNKDFVNLITTKIERVTSKGLKTVDGVEYQADAIIFATGFDLEVMMMMNIVIAMMMMMIVSIMMMMSRQARSLIPKKDWKGN